MVIIRPLLTAAALLAASFASASPLQGDRLEERVPFCESRNPIVVSLRNSPQATAFCSSFLSIGPPTTTKTVLRTVRTIFTRPTPVSTTRTTGTVTSTQAVATGFTDQVSIIQETPSSTQTSIVTEASVEVSVTVATETSTISEPSTIFETSVSTETSVITELTETSTTSFIATTTRTTLADDVLRRGAAQATPAALYDKRLLSPNVIRSSRDAISSACSCIVKRPVQRTRTTTRSVTFTSIRPPTSTRTIVTSVTTVLPQASTIVTRETLTTTTLPTAVSITLTTVTTPTTTETQTTTTSPFTVTYPTTDLDQSATTTLTTTTTTSTSVVEATQTANVAYADRCAAAGAAPDAALRFLTATDVSEAACGNVCQRDSRCKSWVWQAQGQYCQLFTANLFRAGFVAADDGAARGYDVSCTVPPSQARPVPSCGGKGYGNVPNPFLTLPNTSRAACSAACYDNDDCASYSVDTAASTCSLYRAQVAEYLVLDGFLGEQYFDRTCSPPPGPTCRLATYATDQGTFQNAATSYRLCALACQASETCQSFSVQGDRTSTSRICRHFTVKVNKLNLTPIPPNFAEQLFSDRACEAPEPIAVPCGSAGFPVKNGNVILNAVTLQKCNARCDERATCLSFIYQADSRRCQLYDDVADDIAYLFPSTTSSYIYNRGCSTPQVQVCNALGGSSFPPPPSLAVLTDRVSFQDCALACQQLDTCASVKYRPSPNTCTLYTDSSADKGYFATVEPQSARWNDKSCGLPPADNCGRKASSLPSSSSVLRSSRDLPVGQDSLALCDDLCRRDYQCLSYSFGRNADGTTTSCRTYVARFDELDGIGLTPAGPISYTDATQCSALVSDVASLDRICASPPGIRPDIGALDAESYAFTDAASSLQTCASNCQASVFCESYAGRQDTTGNGQYLCFLWNQRAVVDLSTGGPRGPGPEYLTFPSFYDKSCPVSISD